jgi:hypothetical protein
MQKLEYLYDISGQSPSTNSMDFNSNFTNRKAYFWSKIYSLIVTYCWMVIRTTGGKAYSLTTLESLECDLLIKAT